ncbi:hypothetical protein NEPTK9_001368 [Candidatus Neptunochlamydia vexilliferae]|uniref:AAA-ATPase-like domain-containing protein n=2 Tax=Candidatus Neptunichlamydia vexilliferae TaxID=1651774 RepID=A0ABS0B0E0_9BACT|nr:hypothetical protein [Candidatus Neptunochlamydia vexilliferae]
MSNKDLRMKKLPIGLQSISEVIEGDYVYIDKTQFAYNLIEQGKHYFIARPRRFGKSLFLNTLKEILKGNKELFKECAIASSSYKWKQYPVVHLDFSKIANNQPDQLKSALQTRLEIIAKKHAVPIITDDIQVALDRLVVELSSKYKSQVAVLIDEYDKPIIDNLKNIEIAEANRDILKDFFGSFKSLDKHLKMTFITGISKFSQVSLFSGFNNLKDLTTHPRYATLFGYSHEEITHGFSDHIEDLSQQRACPTQEILDEMKQWYNGYHFSYEGDPVYNPFSTLNYLDEGKPQSFWYNTGTPSFLIDLIKKMPTPSFQLSGIKAKPSEILEISDLDDIDLKALMWQTGYLTFQSYDLTTDIYTLDFPNQEVRRAFFDSLIQKFAKISPAAVSIEGVVDRCSIKKRFL